MLLHNLRAMDEFEVAFRSIAQHELRGDFSLRSKLWLYCRPSGQNPQFASSVLSAGHPTGTSPTDRQFDVKSRRLVINQHSKSASRDFALILLKNKKRVFYPVNVLEAPGIGPP
jgi:hypothetical protein